MFGDPLVLIPTCQVPLLVSCVGMSFLLLPYLSLPERVERPPEWRFTKKNRLLLVSRVQDLHLMDHGTYLVRLY